MNLSVKIFAVRDNKECEVPRQFPTHLSHEHDHGVAFARTLSMPEHAEFPDKLSTAFHIANQMIHAKVLMILRDNLGAFSVEQNKVFDVVYQPFLSQKPIYKASHAQAMLFDMPGQAPLSRHRHEAIQRKIHNRCSKLRPWSSLRY